MQELTNEAARAALDAACGILRGNLPQFTDQFQSSNSEHNFYQPSDNVEWTTGFCTGEYWLAWEHTREDAFKTAALRQVDSFLDRIQRKIDVDHHDMGFLYTPSCVAACKLTGSETGRKAALLAADQLCTRFREKGQFIQAWGPNNAKDNYRLIIDCLLNLPLLYWASEVTGDSKYADIAHRHITTCLANSFRPDGSTYHTFFMNPDGTPSHGATCQGYRDDSFWARGQAWGVYGSVLSYRYTKNPEYLDTFRRALDFYMTRLPADLVPYWDMIFTTGSEEPRDSSSAAIVACGLLEAVKWVDAEEGAAYEKLARQMMASLVQHYAVTDHKPGAGLVLHGTYSKKSPYNTCTPEGVDECVSWGDYFYMEALTRLTTDWKLYW